MYIKLLLISLLLFPFMLPAQKGGTTKALIFLHLAIAMALSRKAGLNKFNGHCPIQQCSTLVNQVEPLVFSIMATAPSIRFLSLMTTLKKRQPILTTNLLISSYCNSVPTMRKPYLPTGSKKCLPTWKG